MASFLEPAPTRESLWRAIILFGMNTASYKFALGKTLLEYAAQGQSILSLQELARPFAMHIVEHLRRENVQATAKQSQFLDSCRSYAHGSLTEDELITVTVRLGFKHVLDAFHTVFGQEISTRFFLNERPTHRRIILTDAMFKLVENPYAVNLPHEIEARWRLVETAWATSISTKLLEIHYDSTLNDLCVVPSQSQRRVSVTSARAALNGYQRGVCFYCCGPLRIDQQDKRVEAEVDHFFPHVLKAILPTPLIDGVWNLVLACSRCNRGVDGGGGKGARLPERRYLERLAQRNTYLIESHHPLRETIMQQTGRTRDARYEFLNNLDRIAIHHIIHRWKPMLIYAEDIR